MIGIDALKSFYGEAKLMEMTDSFTYEQQWGTHVPMNDDLVMGKYTYFLKWAQQAGDEDSIMPNDCYVQVVPLFQDDDDVWFGSLFNEAQFLKDFDDPSDRTQLIIRYSKAVIDSFPVIFDNDPNCRVENATKGRDYNGCEEFLKDVFRSEQGMVRRTLFFFEYDWKRWLPKLEKWMKTCGEPCFDNLDDEKRKIIWDEKLAWQKGDPAPLEANYNQKELLTMEVVCERFLRCFSAVSNSCFF